MNRVQIREARQAQEERERLSRFGSASEIKREHEVHSCPPILRIEVINRCNANCVFCAYQYQSRSHSVMDFDVFKRAIDQYTALGGTAINFSPVVGDSLLDDSLEEKVAYVRENPQYETLEIWTNAILLTRARFESLVRAGMNQFHISMPGFSEQEYSRVYRVNSYPKLIQNLQAIADSPELEKVDFLVHSRTDSLHPEQQPDYVALKRRNAFPIVFEPNVVSWHGAIQQEDLSGHMFLVNSVKDQRRPCLVLWGGLTVLADGRMTLCGCTDLNGDGLPVGNIMTDNLDDHLRDGRWARIRDGFYDGDPPDFCKGCDSYYPKT